MYNNISKDLSSTKATGHDLAIADKDIYGVLYSPDGKRLLGIEPKSFCGYDYVIKDGTEVICDSAFRSTLIRNVVIPDSVIAIGKGAFNRCYDLKRVCIGKGVKIIKEYAFRCCKKLEELSLSDNIETIETMAFFDTNIKELIIPRLCSKITGNPIEWRNIRIQSNSPYFIVENDVLFTSDKHKLISYQSSISTYTIPKSVERIGSFAFVYCPHLKSIIIPPSVKEIGINPFGHCNVILNNQSKDISFKGGLLINIRRNSIIGCYSKNKTIFIPDGIQSIEREAFWNTNIKEVKLPYSIKSIKEYAFDHSTIEKIKLPNSIKYLGDCVFYNCSSLEKVNLPRYLQFYGVGIFLGCSSLRTIDIPKNIKHIKTEMFRRCRALRKVNFSNSQQKICESAFFECSSIEEIIIPKSIEYIDKYAFRFCERLKAVYIPDSVKYIGFKAFNDCQEVTEHRRGRSVWHEYDSMNLIATTPGNKDRLVKMLPKFLHDIIKEMTYKEFVTRNKSLYNNVNTDEEYSFGSLERVKCPRCGNWYFEEDGGCDVCGYPWNE